MRVLIIDPAPFQRRILALLLEARGLMGAEGFGSIEDVTTRAGSQDLVFCESTACADGIPIAIRNADVIVTGPEKSDALLADAVTAGAAAFLPKPYTEAGLAMALDDLAIRRDAKSMKRPADMSATGATTS